MVFGPVFLFYITAQRMSIPMAPERCLNASTSTTRALSTERKGG